MYLIFQEIRYISKSKICGVIPLTRDKVNRLKSKPNGLIEVKNPLKGVRQIDYNLRLLA